MCCILNTSSKLYIILTLSPGGYEIFYFDRLSLTHQYYLVSLSYLCPGVEKKVLKEIMHFHYMTYADIRTILYGKYI